MFNSKYPDQSKVWVYQSNRPFTKNEIQIIQDQLNQFISKWDSHGSMIDGEGIIVHNQFISVVADNTNDVLCGSAADRLVKLMRHFEQELDVILLDRMSIAYKKEGSIHVASMQEFRELLNNGSVDENTIVFNNVITKKSEFENNWEVPVKDSWHKQLLEVVA